MSRVIIIFLSLFIIFAQTSYAHPGNTAADGCHYCRTNCDKWGVPWNERHCHGGGVASDPAPQHAAPAVVEQKVQRIFTPKPATSTPRPTATPIPTNTPTLTPSPTISPTPTVTPAISVGKVNQGDAEEKSENNFVGRFMKSISSFFSSIF